MASAGPYASLHLAPDRQSHHSTKGCSKQCKMSLKHHFKLHLYSNEFFYNKKMFLKLLNIKCDKNKKVVKEFWRKAHRRGGNPKLPLSLGEPGPRLRHGSLGPPESAPKMASWSVQSFWHRSRLWPTCRHTDHGTSVTIGCIFAIRACDAVA